MRREPKLLLRNNCISYRYEITERKAVKRDGWLTWISASVVDERWQRHIILPIIIIIIIIIISWWVWVTGRWSWRWWRRRNRSITVDCRTMTSSVWWLQFTHSNNASLVSVVLCAHARKVHCAVVGSCYTSGWPCTEHVCLRREVGVFRREVGHFRRIFDREGGIAHQPVLVSEN